MSLNSCNNNKLTVLVLTLEELTNAAGLKSEVKQTSVGEDLETAVSGDYPDIYSMQGDELDEESAHQPH